MSKGEGWSDMRRRYLAALTVLFMIVGLPLNSLLTDSIGGPGLAPNIVYAAEYGNSDPLFEDDPFAVDEAEILDPFEPLNRFFFTFNDRFYFWCLKPAAKVWQHVLPKDARICVRNVFTNVLMPVRLVNCLFQGKWQAAGSEVSRFVINSTIGVLGCADPARDEFNIVPPGSEDLGQSLGFYGVGHGLYFCWPFIGPSSARDTLGLVGDSLVNPVQYIMRDDAGAGVALYGLDTVNQTSLTLGDYESFLESAFDPYIALRDAYLQHRRHKVSDSLDTSSIY